MRLLTKSEGITPSERYLKKLCECSFLSLWSYPNVYRDQGGGKEICDLLVVFENHVIIFSDKSCKFQDSGNTQQDWRRWYRDSILKSANQTIGAERWIRQHPDRVFLDIKCTQKFPLEFGDPKKLKFHRIAIALNAAERCHKELGGSGSLFIAPCSLNGRIVGDTSPFIVDKVDAKKPFVHILDDVTLDIVLRELDTVKDFVDYLAAKEDLIASGCLGYFSKEEDLLAVYLTHMTKEGEHGFPNDGHKMCAAEGAWNNLLTQEAFLKKRERNSISYFWDTLIEQFSRDVIDGTTVDYFPELPFGNVTVANSAEALAIMAAESRFSRRFLAKRLDEIIQNTSLAPIKIRLAHSPNRPTVAFVFLIASSDGFASISEYMREREALLLEYCFAAKHRYPELLDIIGIALVPPDNDGSARTLFRLNARQWTKEEAAFARRCGEDRGLLKHSIRIDRTEMEYPSSNRPTVPSNPEIRRRMRIKKKRERKERNS